MEFLDQYADHIGQFLLWVSSPETTVPIFRLLQGLAATIGALISALGFYKAWRFAESRMGRRLSEFLAQEAQNVVLARQLVKDIRNNRSAVRPGQLKIFSNQELRKALKQVRSRHFSSAQAMLSDTVARTKERELLAREQAALHEKQRAMAHLLLGAIADARNDHRSALAHFQTAIEIDSHDVEALEYLGLQFMKLGDSAQALEEFEKLAEVAEIRGDHLLLAHAHRNRGLAFEAPPNSSPTNANIAYKQAIQAFPQNGPPLDIAHIHELRGLVNIKLRNNQRANASLMSALARYSQLEHSGGVEAREAGEGVRRIHAALAELGRAQNGAQLQLDVEPAALSGEPSSRPPALVVVKSTQQQAGEQPPNRERPN